MTNHLFDGLLAKGRKAPERRFALMPDGRTYSYRDVEEVSARFASTLVALGLKPGDRVAVQVEKSIEALMLYLGTVRAGGVFLPLNTAYTPAEIDYFLTDATPAIFVCDPKKREALAPIAEKAGAVIETLGVWTSPDASAGSLSDKTLGADATFSTIERSAVDLAAILYTSGTTGRSKGAMLSHENLLSNAEVLEETWGFTQDDVLLHALPIFHTHGLFVASNTVTIAGGSMIFLPKFDPDTVFQYLPQATSMMGVPTFYTRLLADERLNRETTAHMRLFTSGSAPLLAETHRAFEARTGQRILERYGMTETNMNTSNPLEGERRAGTVGFPLKGCELRIVDEKSGERLPTGEIGVIEVKGPNVFSGYWKMPEKTKAEFREDGYFITGDLGLIDEDGYVTIVGRGKDLVITGGYNVYPKEVELAIDELPGVVESAVIGVPHPDFGEGVVGVVVAKEMLEEKALLDQLKDRLAKFKQPKRIVFVDELPRNTMGKVQKNVLREENAKLFA
ncbi:malonyl-CoA/methylmalonyl-CoA synthetase [Fulvimarina manganoxydans]|uniref:Malonyl-CoA/methylmalonyl-CoA synthetase n=1 Tax=Fulvimarina manganoxydans TaxID=937218 RepID=A0A1W2BAM8_9HYPH|nr:malonyl-CoA synthase [Fulvimarina manganoxydans]SMC70047.1 malonyl-CoA/methylmalonyl-CoA synthetase [Fulvimarina manganoxydans]